MTDEKYSFVSDVRDKKVTARSARSKRTHTGKGGRVRLPSDNLSKKELQKMNGECKSYKLNSPMTWKEFKSMPDDIKITYIKLLREKFRCPDSKIGEMMGATKDQTHVMFKRLGLNNGHTRKRTNWDKDGFYAWWHGVDMLPTPVPEEPAEESIPEEKEAFVDDDLPHEEPDPELDELRMEISLLNAQVDGLQKANDALMASHENDCQVIEKLRLMCSEYEEKAHILEAQMEVVRLIFGGVKH